MCRRFDSVPTHHLKNLLIAGFFLTFSSNTLRIDCHSAISVLSPLIDFNGFIKEWLDHEYSDGYMVANKASLSWASGKKIQSHFRFLQDYLKSTGETAPLEVLNFAFPRDTTHDLDNQTRQLIKARCRCSTHYRTRLYIDSKSSSSI